MEKIKVNMSPNPLDVQTIHASQNDGEARQWEFELHNNGELIDTSNVKEQLVFKAYKGGTEQLLPENGSVPTTSPFKGDIRYPQGLLADQEFTYRQSPTESDGLAKITDIKGNTLNWNQLLPSLASTKEWNGISITNNDDGSLTFDGTYTGTSTGNLYVNPTNMSMLSTHWYLYDFSNSALNGFVIRISSSVGTGTLQGHGATINRPNADTNDRLVLRIPVGTTFNNVKVYPQIYDLTHMFGTEKAQEMRDMEVAETGSGVAYFRSLFPLSYYSYNQGSLLSFSGNGIKTVGKNLIGEMTTGFISTTDGVSITSNPYWLYSDFIGCFENEYMCFSANINNRGLFYCYDSSRSFKTVVQVETGESYVRIRPKVNNIAYVRIGFNVNGASTLVDPSSVETYELQVEYNDHRTEYEPYTSSTLSLPISTYFPNGMDGVGTDYDELTNTKATARMTRVDLGSLTWRYSGTLNYFYTTISDMKSGTQNALCDKYSNSRASSISQVADKQFMIYENEFRIKDTAYTTTDAFKSAMSGVYLVYPLATPIETSFTTASLVTENAEIPLSNNDGVLIGKCTEQLSENPGFIDAKIKLADADGECYSNKIQLHVERSPQ